MSWGKKLPPILLLHGNADKCAPIDNAERFAAALREGGAAVELKTYEGQTHTSPLIENPMRGGRDLLQASAAIVFSQSLLLHFVMDCWCITKVHLHTMLKGGLDEESIPSGVRERISKDSRKILIGFEAGYGGGSLLVRVPKCPIELLSPAG